MAFEAGFSKRVEKDIHGPAPDITPQKGLKDILGNVAENKLLDHYLEAENWGLDQNTEAWQRYLDGKPSPADTAIVQGQVEGFRARKARFERAHETLKKFSNDMLENSPVFLQLRNFNGEASLNFVLQNGLLDLALANESEFKAVEAELQKLSDQKKKEEEYDKKIKDFADIHGIEDSDRMKTILTLPTEKARQEAIRGMLREKMGVVGRFFDKIGGGARREARTISPDDLPKDISERKAAYKAAGGLFTTLLETNNEFRHALARMNTGQEPTFPEGSEAKLSLAESRNEAKNFEKAAVMERAKAFREKNKKDDWDDPAIRDQLRAEFQKTEEKLSAGMKKRGFFASVLLSLAVALFDVKTDKDIEKVLDKKT